MPSEQPAKTVLITGCSSGIGAALAEEFFRRGFIVYATARRLDSVAALAQRGMRTLALDVTDSSSIAAAIIAIGQERGGLDLLINNAGFTTVGPTAELGEDRLRHQLETNVVGAMATLRLALPLLERRRGVIANIGSIVGVAPLPFRGFYGASKAALNALSDALRMELKPFGIRVVSVQPGGIQTSIADKSAGMDLTGSRYEPIAGAIERDRRVSQLNAMPAEEFARRLVDLLLRPRPPAVIRLGTNSRLLPAMKRLLPTAWLDLILGRRFGLSGFKPG
jgi:NAD(P)-dependent dehydrogenase (short-subunit alcohol dehydrogenase family)